MKTLQDKIDFIMSKVVDYALGNLDYDVVRDSLEDIIMLGDKETAISFRDWCINKQQPDVINEYHDMNTSELWDKYSNN